MDGQQAQPEINTADLTQNPQLHKPHYYNSVLIDSKGLLSNEQFVENISAVLAQGETGAQKSEKFERTEEEVLRLIGLLQREIGASEQNFVNIAKGIISLREQYQQLQRNQHLARDSIQLNLELLKLEEFLVELQVISLEEVQNPALLENPQHSEEQVTAILQNFVAKNDQKLQVFLENLAKNFLDLRKQSQTTQAPSKGTLPSIRARVAQSAHRNASLHGVCVCVHM